MRLIVNHPAFADIPGILEVPGYDGQGPDRANLDTLRELRGGGGLTVETRVVAEELDLTTATSLRELLESGGIARRDRRRARQRVPRHAADGRLRHHGRAAHYDEARRLVDELEHEAGQEPPQGQ